MLLDKETLYKAGLLENDEQLEPIALRRIKICRQCNEYNHTFLICSVCNCFMPIKTKFKTSSCPQNKWQAE